MNYLVIIARDVSCAGYSYYRFNGCTIVSTTCVSEIHHTPTLSFKQPAFQESTKLQ